MKSCAPKQTSKIIKKMQTLLLHSYDLQPPDFLYVKSIAMSFDLKTSSNVSFCRVLRPSDFLIVTIFLCTFNLLISGFFVFFLTFVFTISCLSVRRTGTFIFLERPISSRFNINLTMYFDCTLTLLLQ